nr:nucleotide-binding domain containing protein [Paenibacillus dendritiformis]
MTPSAGRDEEKAGIGQTLVVSGSLSETTRRQLLYVRDMPDACALEVDPASLVTGDYDAAHYVQSMKRQMDKCYFVLYVDSSEHCRTAAQEAGKRVGKSLPEVSEAISRGLGKIARAMLEGNQGIQGLVLTGGDTAKAVSMELGTGEMQLYAEAEPGLPFGKLVGKERSYWAITKAGGFGHDRSLAAALDYMSNEKRVRA